MKHLNEHGNQSILHITGLSEYQKLKDTRTKKIQCGTGTTAICPIKAQS
jgi:hypothetical protein